MPRGIPFTILLAFLLLGLATASEQSPGKPVEDSAAEREERPPFCSPTSSESEKSEDEDEDGLAVDDGPPCVELPSEEPTDAREDEAKMSMSDSETDYELTDTESLPGELSS